MKRSHRADIFEAIAELEFEEDGSESEWESEVNRKSPEYIRWVQSSLNRIMGLQLDVDGDLGSQTRSAVRSFQRQQGLTVDGKVGSQTEAALIAAGAGQPPQSAPSYGGGSAGATPDLVSVRGIRVARSIAPQVSALLEAAQRDGITFGGGGYRTPAGQIHARRQNCGPTHYDIYEKPSKECHPPTARPGRSMHERGLAIDFTYRGRSIRDHNNPGFQWLDQNAARFGLYNLPSEPWHWSTNGH